MTFSLSSLDHPAINAEINHNHDETQEELKATCEKRGIEERGDVTFDEVGGISGSSSPDPKPVLHGGQGADPACEFNKGAPEGCRNVKPCPALFVKGQETAKDDEQNEKEVGDDHHICKDGKKHDI